MSRKFANFPEAFSEIARDLKEMGLPVHTRTMQDKLIDNDGNFATLELQNYQYTVTDALEHRDELEPTQPWANHEWEERLKGIMGNPINPGVAWKYRMKIWEEFLHNGKFSYSYPDMLAKASVMRIVERLRKDPMSRQAIIPLYAPEHCHSEQTRVPCSLNYKFLFRQGQLDITYGMRSCDFSTHFQNDIFFALKMLEFMCAQTRLPAGNFTHQIDSFHVYNKDVADVF